MESFIKYCTGLIAVVALVFGLAAYNRPVDTTSPPVGANASGDFYTPVQFFSSVLHGNAVASSSIGTGITVSATDFAQWANASVVSYTPNRSGLTLTLPASSTINFVVPRAGDRQNFCIRNATTTANTPVILAGGTGTNLLVASSSVSALGSLQIATGKVVCLSVIREAATATTFDIDALMTAFK